MQQDVAQYYATKHPGEVQVLGVDLWNGTAAQLGNFRAVTGASFPLLLNGATAAGGNVELLYGTYDNYVVLNRQRIVRYHATLAWPHGDRYHLDEIRGCVDSLVTNLVGVPPGRGEAIALSAVPNPTRGVTRLAVTLPDAVADAEIAVFDVGGRRCATLHRGPLAPGRHELRWDARGASGAVAAPGVYRVRARLGRDVCEVCVVVVR